MSRNDMDRVARPLRVAGRTLRTAAGSTLVETALVLPLFIILFCGILDFSRLFYTQLTVQHALREAGRFAVTGRHLSRTNNTSQLDTRINSILRIAQQSANGIPLVGFSIGSAQSGTNSAGGPGDTVTISIAQNIHFITPLVPMMSSFMGATNFMNNGTYCVQARTVFRNEPFPPDQTN
jgi:Flp pilus assembly protein TadG